MAPVSVTALLEPPVPAVHVMQVPQVHVIEKTVEFPFLPQIVETPETVVEMVRFASHEQVQQQTVEHVPQIFKETAESIRLALH